MVGKRRRGARCAGWGKEYNFMPQGKTIASRKVKRATQPSRNFFFITYHTFKRRTNAQKRSLRCINHPSKPALPICPCSNTLLDDAHTYICTFAVEVATGAYNLSLACTGSFPRIKLSPRRRSRICLQRKRKRPRETERLYFCFVTLFSCRVFFLMT